MSAQATEFPYWASTPTPDLLAAAEEYERTAERIMAHVPKPAADDRELAEFLSTTAADLRREIARRANR